MSALRSFPIAIGIIAAYRAVRLSPQDFARLCVFDQPGKDYFFNKLLIIIGIRAHKISFTN
jgi:hypothetical protein